MIWCLLTTYWWSTVSLNNFIAWHFDQTWAITSRVENSTKISNHFHGIIIAVRVNLLRCLPLDTIQKCCLVYHSRTSGLLINFRFLSFVAFLLQYHDWIFTITLRSLMFRPRITLNSRKNITTISNLWWYACIKKISKQLWLQNLTLV